MIYYQKFKILINMPFWGNETDALNKGASSYIIKQHKPDALTAGNCEFIGGY